MVNKIFENNPIAPSFYDGDISIIPSDSLAKRLSKRRYLVEMNSKDILARPGDKIDTCYLIKEGLLVSLENIGKHRQIYDYYEKGMFIFIEYAFLNQQCPIYYEALTPLKMYSIRMELVKRLLGNNRKFSNCCLAQMTRNYMVMHDLLRKSVAHSARWRICDLLLVYANKASVTKDNITVLDQPLTKTLISDMLYMSRITVIREWQVLEDLRLCKLKGTRCIIYDLAALREYRDNID